MISIRTLTKDTTDIFNRIGNRYLAEERLTFLYKASSFSLSYTPLPEPQWHSYPPDTYLSAKKIMEQDDAECYFAFWDDQPAGQAIITKHWNRLAMLYDIRVDEQCRGKGVGRVLLDACTGWAKEQDLGGLMAETQSSNPSACKFYQHTGFVLGGIDRLLYTAIPVTEGNQQIQQDSALFFYLLFDRKQHINTR